MDNLKAVIIGCGAIFPMHAVSVKETDGVDLVAVCDIKEKRACEKATEFGCRAYTDYKEMLEAEKPDTVHICLPHFLHAEVSIYAMEHGCDVICEKPMALDIEQAQAMLNCSKRTNSKLSIILQNRYNDVSVALKNEIDSHKPGMLKGARAVVNWYRNENYYKDSDWRGKLATEGGGVVVNQAIHTLDLMLWLAGEKAVSVEANIATRAHDIEVEDSAEGVVRFESGAFGSFWFINYYPCNREIEVELVFENAVLKIENSNAYITYSGNETQTIRPKAEKSDYGNVKGYWGSSHNRQISDFYDYVRNEKEMFVTAEDAFETQKIMCELLRSGRNKIK